MKTLTQSAPGTLEWHAARAGKIGGTAAVSILLGDRSDMRTFSSPLAEWMRLTGRADFEAQERDDELEKILRWGRESEPLHRALLKQDAGAVLVEEAPGVCQDDEIAWLACSPDGIVQMPDGSRLLLEMKAPTRWTYHEWDEGAPVPYQVQAAIGMRVLDIDEALVSALIPPTPRWARVKRSKAFEEHALETLGHFMDYHVAKDIPPPATGKKLDRRMLLTLHPKDNGECVELPGELLADIERLKDVEDSQKDFEHEIEALRNRIAQAIGPNTEGVCGEYRFTFKHQSRAGYAVAPAEFRVLRKCKRKE